MANPVMPPEIGRPRTHPVFIVGGTVLVVTILTFLIYSVGGEEEGGAVFAGGRTATTTATSGACGAGSPDDSYSISVASNPDPPRPEGTTFRLTVRQGGRAVTGAKVCMTSEMPDMQHPGLNTVAKEGSGGRYETLVKFGMGGNWVASVTIAEPGRAVVSLTVPIEVAEITQD